MTGIEGDRMVAGTSFRPVAQTPEELRRECLGTIAGAAKDIERCAMDGKVDALKVQFEFLKVQMRRLETITGTARQKARMI